MSEALGLVSNGDQGSGPPRSEERRKGGSSKSGSERGSAGGTGGPAGGCSCCEGAFEQFAVLNQHAARCRDLSRALTITLATILLLLALQDLELGRLWKELRQLR